MLAPFSSNMLAAERRTASLAYVSSLFASLTCIFYVRSHLLTFSSLVLQLACMAWYGASFLPYGQQMLWRTFSLLLRR